MCIACDFSGGKSGLEFMSAKGSMGNSNRGRNYFFIGVEIEKEFEGRDASEAANNVEQVSNEFFSNSGDGSLDDGVEFQSMPATMGYHRKLYSEGYYDKFFKALDDNGLVSHSNAGSHIHVSNAALDLQTRRKMCKMMHEVFSTRFLSLVARRTMPNRWARRSRDGWDDIAHGIDDEKYYVLNNTDYSPTMEFRIWDSPSTADELMEQIEFVSALKDYCKSRRIENVTQFGFRKFVADNIGRYPNLGGRIASFTPRPIIEQNA